MYFPHYTGEQPGKNIFKKTLSGNPLTIAPSLAVFLRSCFIICWTTFLKNTSRKECLENVLSKVMVKIYGRNTPGRIKIMYSKKLSLQI